MVVTEETFNMCVLRHPNIRFKCTSLEYIPYNERLEVFATDFFDTFRERNVYKRGTENVSFVDTLILCCTLSLATMLIIVHGYSTMHHVV